LAVASVASPTQRHAFLASKFGALGSEQRLAAGRAVAKSHEAGIDIEASARHPGNLFTRSRIRALCEGEMTFGRMEPGLSVASPMKVTRQPRGGGRRAVQSAMSRNCNPDAPLGSAAAAIATRLSCREKSRRTLMRSVVRLSRATLQHVTC